MLYYYNEQGYLKKCSDLLSEGQNISKSMRENDIKKQEAKSMEKESARGLSQIKRKEEHIMLKWIKRILGIKTINSKLEALSSYLNVKFNHIPEHYECEEQKKEI